MPANYVRADWSARKETLASATRLMASFLAMVVSKHGLLTQWYVRGATKADALRSPLPTNPIDLEPMLVARAEMKGADAEMPVVGVSLGAWNGKDGGESASFSVHVGSTSQWVKNTALIELPELTEDEAQRLQSELITALRLWANPDRIVVNGLVI